MWTYAQAEDRKEKAERAARLLQGDDERAEQIASMSPEDYASERGTTINPTGGQFLSSKRGSTAEYSLRSVARCPILAAPIAGSPIPTTCLSPANTLM